MSSAKNKQIGTKLGLQSRWPVLVLFYPALINRYLLDSGLPQFSIELLSFIALLACFLVNFFQTEYRTLFVSNLRFKIGSSVVYFASLVPMLVLKLHFPTSDLAIFSNLFFISGALASIFYYDHFYQPKYLVKAGWVKSTKLIKHESLMEKNCIFR